MLGRLIPEKQLLNDHLKQVQQNSLHSKYVENIVLVSTSFFIHPFSFPKESPSNMGFVHSDPVIHSIAFFLLDHVNPSTFFSSKKAGGLQFIVHTLSVLSVCCKPWQAPVVP